MILYHYVGTTKWNETKTFGDMTNLVGWLNVH
jgi:hypothetical protein